MGFVVSEKYFPFKRIYCHGNQSLICPKNIQSFQRWCVCNFIKICRLAMGILLFEGFPKASLWRLSTSGAWSNIIPGARMTQKPLKHTKYQVVSEKKIFIVFSLKHMLPRQPEFQSNMQPFLLPV